MTIGTQSTAARLGGPLSQSEHAGKEKSPAPYKNGIPVVQPMANDDLKPQPIFVLWKSVTL
jgi:hypothetical protein